MSKKIKQKFIAEVKTKSPFGFKSKKTWKELFSIANKIGDIISIHTDKRWGGSFKLIREAQKLTYKKILAKGIHKTDEDIIQALLSGANYVLVVGRIPTGFPKNQILIEPNNLKQLKEIPKGFNVVWNSRDLKTGKLKKETFNQARKIWKGWLCQASNIKSIKDINKSADAILVGEHLENFKEKKQ